MIDLFAWVVFITMIASAIALFIGLGLWPGRVARERGHVYRDAIAIGSWVLLLLGAVFWPLILIWAYATPSNDQPGTAPAGEDV